MSPALQFNATLFNLKEHCFTEESKQERKPFNLSCFSLEGKFLLITEHNLAHVIISQNKRK